MQAPGRDPHLAACRNGGIPAGGKAFAPHRTLPYVHDSARMDPPTLDVGAIISRVPLSSRREVAQAVEGAQAAYPG